jgi:hypothetical protein
MGAVVFGTRGGRDAGRTRRHELRRYRKSLVACSDTLSGCAPARKTNTSRITAVIKLEKCTQETRSNLVNRSHAPAPAPGGRPVAPVASRVVKLIFTTKRLPLPAAPAPAPALLQDPLLNNCDSVGGDCVTLRSSWRVYCNPRRRLRNRGVPLDCKPGRIPETGAGVGRAMHKRGVRRAGCSEALRTGSAKYCEAIARFRAARAPNPTT